MLDGPARTASINQPADTTGTWSSPFGVSIPREGRGRLAPRLAARRKCPVVVAQVEWWVERRVQQHHQGWPVDKVFLATSRSRRRCNGGRSGSDGRLAVRHDAVSDALPALREAVGWDGLA